MLKGPHVQNWLHQNENLFGHKTNLFGHKTLFDRDGLEKNLRAFGPQIFFSRNFWGCICVAVCWPKSAPPCAGRNLRRRVLAENLAKICAAVLRCHFWCISFARECKSNYTCENRNSYFIFRTMCLMSTLRWPPICTGSTKQFWVWEACKHVASHWRKLPLQVLFTANIWIKKAILWWFWV